jgi:hypothetical protein
MIRNLIALVLLLTSFNTYALLELNGQYGYDRQVFGENRQNKMVGETFSGAIAWYLFETTAIEGNYNQTETTTNQQTDVAIDSTYSVTGQKNVVLLYSYGLGVRQLLAGRKARILPSLSFGYARQFQKDQTTYTFKNESSGDSFTLTDAATKVRYDSVFATFAINFKITKRFSLRVSANTIFEAFKFNRAQDNMKYLVGFTWYL